MNSNTKAIEKLAELLRRENACLVTAESCTGGLVSQQLTAVAGSSAWFDAGFVTYSNHAKATMLSVPLDLINQYGAVSLEVATAMARGACQHSQAQYSIAITGIAGPAGGSPDKPVGTVCFSWLLNTHIEQARVLFSGSREAIRQQAATFAIEQLTTFMESSE